MHLKLEDPPFAGRTGRGVRVAVIDSGIHATHPHISSVARAVRITPDGVDHDASDKLGHGTAVAAAILEKAPGIELYVIRVFEKELSTNASVLSAAMNWAAEQDCALINLSLGSTNENLRAPDRGIVVSAAGWYPGCLPEAVAVREDWTCPRDELRVRDALIASPYPRPIPGIAPEHNLRGISFAVANATGFLARLLEAKPDIRRAADIWRLWGISANQF